MIEVIVSPAALEVEISDHGPPIHTRPTRGIDDEDPLGQTRRFSDDFGGERRRVGKHVAADIAFLDSVAADLRQRKPKLLEAARASRIVVEDHPAPRVRLGSRLDQQN